jgi:transcriptional regulator with XRE-family HTH domain
MPLNILLFWQYRRTAFKMKKLSKRLKTARIEKDLTQSQLANLLTEKLGKPVSLNLISNIENIGKNDKGLGTSIATFFALCRELGIESIEVPEEN